MSYQPWKLNDEVVHGCRELYKYYHLFFFCLFNTLQSFSYNTYNKHDCMTYCMTLNKLVTNHAAQLQNDF